MSELPALPSEATMRPPIGTTFAGTERFRPVTVLGRGSKGVVHRVHDLETGTDVALKTLDTRDADQLYRLKQEFRVLAEITHPNLVQLYELMVSDDACFFTMEFVEGVDFVEHIRGGSGRFPGGPVHSEADLGRLLAASRQLVLGVSALHAEGKLHRDIKPSNMLVTKAGRLVLLDFGLAIGLAIEGIRDTISGVAAGTLAYMAPEQAWGRPPKPAADWYSVGVALYEALTGRLPFTGPPAGILRDKGGKPPPSPRSLVPGIPEPLDAIVTALLDPDPARRPGAQALLECLARCRATTVVPIPPQPAGPREAPFVGRTQEWAKLRFLCNSVARGLPAVVHVMGPSGIGKTELIRRFLSSVEQDGHTLVLRGRCHPRETMPYKGLDTLVDALSRLLISLPASSVATLVPRHTAALVRLFPVLGRVPALAVWEGGQLDADPYEARRRGVKALRELLARIADRQPLILWIDDLQWGDLDSATLLRELLRPPDSPQMALVLSYRSEDKDHIPLLAALKTNNEELPPEWTHEILLGPLAVSETCELARLLCSAQRDSDELISEIAIESAGSPFFLGELARRVGAGWPAPGSGTGGFMRLAEVMGDRVQALPATPRELLEIVSVAGGPLDRSVALSAAGVGEAGRRVLSMLEEEHFLRSTTIGDHAAVEVYHDRIREALIARLSAHRLTVRHRQVAQALELLPDPDPQALFEHYFGAGDTAVAGRYALQAADRAASALAFDRAAQLYRQALDLRGVEADVSSVQLKLAEALANCGRGAEAAKNFERVAQATAERSPGSQEVLALQRRAAEQYLRAGHLDEGIAATRAVLAGVGIKYPDSSRRAVASALFSRVRLLWRGLRFTPHDATEIPAEKLLRLDACYGAAVSLGLADQLVGDALSVRHLREALDLGEVSHIARALALEATKAAQLGGKFMRQRSARILAVLGQLARDSDAVIPRACFIFALGTTAFENAEWRTAHEYCDAVARAAHMLPEHFTGMTFEVVTLKLFSLAALALMGELVQIAPGLPGAISDADERGDLYAAVGLRAGMLNLVWLAQDRPEYARQQADAAIARWPTTTAFHIQHYLHLIATVQADLYERNAWAAWQRIVEAWPRLRKAHFLFLESPAVELRNLRARAALAAATVVPTDFPAGARPPNPQWPPKRLLALADAEARRIARVELPSTPPMAALIRAGIAQAQGRHADAAAAYATAGAGFARADMGLYRAAAQYREGTLRGGDEGSQLQGESVRWMHSQEIQDPAAMGAVFAPVSGPGLHRP